MISVEKFAKRLEDGLNARLNNPEIQFKIWATAGKHVPAHREGNKVTYFINGDLRTSSSANDSNDLVMGINGLSLGFTVPVQPPCVNVKQTAEELQEVKEGQYPFLTYIFNAIDGYFKTAQVFTETDSDGKEFTISFQGGTAIPGAVDMAPRVGQSVPINVFIEAYFIEGGTSAKDISITVNNKRVPFQAVRYGRTPVIEHAVSAGTLTSKNAGTSTAFSIDIDFPSNNDSLTGAVVDYLLGGEPNVAYFVRTKWGEGKREEIHFMTLNTVQSSAKGIAVVGLSVSFMEVLSDISVYNVTDECQVARFEFEGSDINSLTFTPSVPCTAFITGKAFDMGGLQTIALEPKDFTYDEDTDKYFVYLITDRAVDILGTNAACTIIKAANNE